MTSAGDTFILRGGGQRGPHLWIILWGPSGSADAFLVVSFTSLKLYKDHTCVVDAGDHPFFQHPTCVMYSDVRRLTSEKLDVALAKRDAVLQERASRELLERVRAGLFLSAYSVNSMIAMAREEFGA